VAQAQPGEPEALAGPVVRARMAIQEVAMLAVMAAHQEPMEPEVPAALSAAGMEANIMLGTKAVGAAVVEEDMAAAAVVRRPQLRDRMVPVVVGRVRDIKTPRIQSRS